MRWHRLLVSALLAALAIASIAVARLPPPDDLPPDAPDVERARPSTRPSATPPAPVERRRRARARISPRVAIACPAAASPSGPLQRVTGRIMTDDGDASVPLARTRVELFDVPADDEEWIGRELTPVRAVRDTDDAGRFAFVVGPDEQWFIVASAGPCAGVTAAGRGAAELGDLTWTSGDRSELHIVDRLGEPQSEAHALQVGPGVAYHREEADERGRVMVDLSRQVLLTAPGREIRGFIDPRDDRGSSCAGDFTVELALGHDVTVSVVDERGEPWSDLVVLHFSRRGYGTEKRRTDTGGRITFPDLAAHRGATVLTVASSMARAQVHQIPVAVSRAEIVFSR